MTVPVQIVILAGGQGTRFWPISRAQKPKQFLSISSSGESLIQATARRVEPLSSGKPVLVVTNEQHTTLVREHLPYASIIGEPQGRNTAASIGLAAIHTRKKGADNLMVVLPADHSVQDEEGLRKTLVKAIEVAYNHDILVTIGVPPTYPHTGYGYIRRGIPVNGKGYMVRRFFEKPNLERAIEYCESGEFYWNSGMFAWKSSVILEAIQEHMPQLYSGLLEIEAVIGTEAESEVIKKVFEGLEPMSIDFGVLELARNCAVIPAESFGWNDVGSWDAWAEHFNKDNEGNLLHGDAVAIDSQNCVVYSDSRFMAVLGLDDIVVIDSGDAVLVCPRSRVQDVRSIVETLKAKKRFDLM